MSKTDSTNGILIIGANGSGKTTLGRALAARLGYRHIDSEDYYFPPQDIPYTVSRTKDEVIKLMLDDRKLRFIIGHRRLRRRHYRQI